MQLESQSKLLWETKKKLTELTKLKGRLDSIKCGQFTLMISAEINDECVKSVLKYVQIVV